MSKHTVNADGPTWYRLSRESWDKIREAYLAGATGRELAVRWRTSVSSIYNRAWREGWGKHTHGDALARENAAAVAAEEAADLTRPPEAQAFVAGEGAGVDRQRARDAEPLVDPAAGETADPAALARLALAGVGRALARGRLAEARALTGVAESLGRVAVAADKGAREGAAGGDGVDLFTVVRAVLDPEYRGELLATWGDPKAHPAKWLWANRSTEMEKASYGAAIETQRKLEDAGGGQLSQRDRNAVVAAARAATEPAGQAGHGRAPPAVRTDAGAPHRAARAGGTGRFATDG